jgi:hypothetical protein
MSLVVLDAKNARIVSMKMELFSKVTLLLGPSWTLKSLFFPQFEGSPKVSKMSFGPQFDTLIPVYTQFVCSLK